MLAKKKIAILSIICLFILFSLLILLSYIDNSASSSSVAAVMASIQDNSGFFNSTGYILNPELFPDLIKPKRLLWGGSELSGILTADNLYFTVKLVEFDYDLYEKFIIPFEKDFASSGIYVIPENSELTYIYANYALIDSDGNFSYYHSVSVVLPNPQAGLNPSINPFITKAIYFFKYIP